MYWKRLLGGVTLTAVLFGTLAAGAASADHVGGSRTVEITASRDSGVSGTADFADTDDGVEITLDLEGLSAGDQFISHIHQGSNCLGDRAGNTAEPRYNLEPITAAEDETGSVTSLIEGVTVEELSDDSVGRYLNVHEQVEAEGDSLPPGIACGDLGGTSSAVSSTSPGGGYSGLPATGGLPVLSLPTLVVLLAIGSGAFVLRRRLSA